MGWLLSTSDSGAVTKANGEEEAALYGVFTPPTLGVGRLASHAETVAAVGSPPWSSHVGAVESFAAPQLGTVLLVWGLFTLSLLCAGTWADSGPAKGPGALL